MAYPLAMDNDSQFFSFFSADQVVSPYVYVFYVAYIVAFLFTPAMRKVAQYYGIIDQPDSLRKMHKTPVAYLGGAAVFMGWLSGMAATQFISMHRVEPDFNLQHLVVNFGLVVGACIIVLLGLWDDVFAIRPWAKIVGQVAAAVALLVGGIGRNAAWIFIGPVLNRLHVAKVIETNPEALLMASHPYHWVLVAMSAAFVIFIVVFCCNATNLMDGLDGLCGGVTGIVSLGFLFLAVNLAMHSGALDANTDGVRVALGLALMGAVLGFVPYNFNPASIFLGDTGSMLVGFISATMIVLFAQSLNANYFLASLVVFALPVLDTTLAFVRRWVNGRPLFSADRFHIHHQLVARGFSVKQTVLISYGLAVAFAALGASITFTRTRYSVAIYLVVFGSIIVAAYKMGMIHERPRVATRHGLGEDSVATPLTPDGEVLELPDTPRGEPTAVAASSHA